MAQRGPKPLPGKVLELRGSRWATSRPQEPLPRTEIPRCPSSLDKDGRKLWRTLTSQLHDMQLIGAIDQQALARYVTLLQRWQAAQRFVEEHGETYTVTRKYSVKEGIDHTGQPYEAHTVEITRYELYPQAKLSLMLADRLLRLETMFAMSPSARASLGLQLAQVAAREPDSTVPPNPKRFLTLG